MTKTTVVTLWRTHIVLWFAQNSLPLRWQRQLQCERSEHKQCCDLLKIHYLCGDKDNGNTKHNYSALVVICSKFITFAVTKTTICSFCSSVYLLWFAQNSLPLRWQRQHSVAVVEHTVGCDLLKIHYLCGDKDNPGFWLTKWTMVVICSKFITFAVTKTTYLNEWRNGRWLWFAQNSLPLRWQRQLHSEHNHEEPVVICSKFITFAVTKTTKNAFFGLPIRLWFAQNSLPLRWQRQLLNDT